VKTAILSAVLLASLSTTEAEIGTGVLMIWPTARSTALAGAMTGLADEADATYFNPAGLAFQTTAKAGINYANWLPGLYQGMYYASAAGGTPVRLPFLRGRNAFIAGSLTHLTSGEIDIVSERGDFLGRFTSWRGVLGVHVGIMASDAVGLGLGLKLLHSHLETELAWWWPATSRAELGLDLGGTGTSVAIDAGLIVRLHHRLSTGLCVANLGPEMSYRYANPWLNINGDYSAPPPHSVRIGACWTPVESRYLRLRVMPELDKVLIGMFCDTTGTKTFCRMLGEEWKDAWKALGIEATAFGVLTFRLGYFEDLTNQRGGLVYEKDRWNTEHYGIGDVLAGRHLGKFKSIGLCWGFGIGYKDYFRFDVSSDAAIYDFPTKNWKMQLTCNDIGGLL